MRKNDARKWLHAALDLLPVILIPVFMIYSHRHDMTERTEIEITYKYQSNEVNSNDDLVNDNIYLLEYDGVTFENTGSLHIDDLVIHVISGYVEYEQSDFIFNGNIQNINNVYLTFDSNGQDTNLHFDNNYMVLGYFYAEYPVIQCNDYSLFLRYFGDLMGEDAVLTYTDYNEIESVVVEDTNSDVMSVFMDDFNNAVDKYFNMGNVFNMTGVYSWFNTNIFNGSAPTVIYSVWNIVLYEFIMDLLFLLYGLFMFFIDCCECLMDRFYHQASGRKRK